MIRIQITTKTTSQTYFVSKSITKPKIYKRIEKSYKKKILPLMFLTFLKYKKSKTILMLIARKTIRKQYNIFKINLNKT